MGYYYLSANGLLYSGDQLKSVFGVNVESYSVVSLNSLGFYPVQPTTPDFDTGLYDTTSTWSIVPIIGGEGAERVYTPVAKPLATAQTNGKASVKAKANDLVDLGACACGYTNDLLTAIASLPEVDRPARFQAELLSMAKVGLKLDLEIVAINAATTVDEVNDVVNPPTGTINLSRTGEDLNAATFSAFSSMTLTEAGTELFVPGTSTTISWSGTDFPATVAAFNVGDYAIQLRQVANGLVIKEFEVTTTPTDHDF